MQGFQSVVSRVLVLVYLWSTSEGMSVDLGLCSDTVAVCKCGSGSTAQDIIIPIKQCSRGQGWVLSCEPCEPYTQAALCSRFKSCLTCLSLRTGGCRTCPEGRYGSKCQGVCQCQNNGVCQPKTGDCQCPSGYRGKRCEQRDLTTCNIAVTLRNGQTTGATTGSVSEGSVATYTCNEGFVLVGPQRKRCESNGQWSGGIPRCEYSCLVPPRSANLQISLTSERTISTPDNPNGVQLVRGARFSCSTGYNLQGLSELSCLDTGRWNGEIPTCAAAVNCPAPTVPNGLLRTNSATYIPGTRISIRCASGYVIEGAASVTCGNDGQWDNTIPRCNAEVTTAPPVSCPTLQAPDNGQMQTPLGGGGNFLPGHRVEFTCDKGHAITGSRERFCLLDGTWTGLNTGCIRVQTCADPGIPQNAIREIRLGRISRLGGRARISSRDGSEGEIPVGYFRVSTRISFSCESRFYTLVGSQYRTCLSSSKWSGRQPTCIPICGKSDGARTPTIIRGEVSRLGEWPWQASIAHRQRDGQFYGVCGGTMISENWIVTAAHCVTNRQSTDTLPLDDIKMYLGKYYRDFSKDDEFVQEFEPSEIHVHPNYDPNELDSDMALVRLSRPANLTDRASPACLPRSDSTGIGMAERLIQPGSMLTVTGWGQTENETDADVLMIASIGTISSKECEERYKAAGEPLAVTDNMFCAGHDDGRSDTCFGDSGGPAVSYTGSGGNRKWYLVGVVSWGSEIGCGLPNRYSGFTRVSRFLSFIEQNTGL